MERLGAVPRRDIANWAIEAPRAMSERQPSARMGAPSA